MSLFTLVLMFHSWNSRHYDPGDRMKFCLTLLSFLRIYSEINFLKFKMNKRKGSLYPPREWVPESERSMVLHTLKERENI